MNFRIFPTTLFFTHDQNNVIEEVEGGEDGEEQEVKDYESPLKINKKKNVLITKIISFFLGKEGLLMDFHNNLMEMNGFFVVVLWKRLSYVY